MFWAEHYLIDDELADALLRQASVRHPARLESALSDALRIRKLVELGVLVPVPAEVATVLAADATLDATRTDLARKDLIRWVDSQLVVEGPTAREALIINARDDTESGALYMYGHIDPVPDAEGLFQTTSLRSYDAGHDYSDWIAQSRAQTGSAFVQEVDRRLAVADAFGAELLTDSPFRARLLHRKDHRMPSAGALVFADIPVLPDADPVTLARVAGEDEAVADLRRMVRRAFRNVRDDNPHGIHMARQGSGGGAS